MENKTPSTFGRDIMVTGGEVFTPAYAQNVKKIVIRDGEFVHVGDNSRVEGQDECRHLDAQGLVVVPGYIDIHTHGGGGAAVTDGTSDAILTMVKSHSETGTTGILPTIISSPAKKMLTSLRAIKEASEANGGEAILGAHLEGPWLNPKQAGAHKVEYLQKPDMGLARELVAEFKDFLKLVTISPELPTAIDVIEYLSESGVTVAIGHTEASYNKTLAAYGAGAKGVTHIFNAMAPLHHRNPGPLGATFDHASATAELIADGQHVTPWMIGFLMKVHGHWNTALVTDSLAPAGTTRSLFQVGETFVEIKNGCAYTDEGNIYGSILTMEQAVRNIRSYTELQIEDVLPMATTIPATYIGVEKRIGTIRTGMRGDLLLLDQNFTVKAAVVKGKLVYRRRDENK